MDRSLSALFEEFRLSRQSAKPSPHSERAARSDFAATESQARLGHEALNTSQGSIEATANQARQTARANRTYQTLRQLQFSPRTELFLCRPRPGEPPTAVAGPVVRFRRRFVDP